MGIDVDGMGLSLLQGNVDISETGEIPHGRLVVMPQEAGEAYGIIVVGVFGG